MGRNQQGRGRVMTDKRPAQTGCDVVDPPESSPIRPLTELDIARAREGYTFRTAQWVATLDALLTERRVFLDRIGKAIQGLEGSEDRETVIKILWPGP